MSRREQLDSVRKTLFIGERSVRRSASLNGRPYFSVVRLFRPRSVACKVAVSRVLSEFKRADGGVRFKVSAWSVKHYIVKVGDLSYKSVDTVGVCQAVFDYRQIKTLPEDSVCVHIDKQKQIVFYLARKLLLA